AMRARTAGIGALAMAAALTPFNQFVSRAAVRLPVQVPVLSEQTPIGANIVARLPDHVPTTKVIDGSIADWTGTSPGFAGATVADRGELIYQDHLFDAYGADDGHDAQRLRILGPIIEALPNTYRVDALEGADPAGEFGIDLPENP